MELAYKDYQRLNGKLIRHYCLNDFSNIALDILGDLKIEEIELTEFGGILVEAKKDFNYGIESNDELEILEFGEIINYINKAVCECSIAIEKYL